METNKHHQQQQEKIGEKMVSNGVVSVITILLLYLYLEKERGGLIGFEVGWLGIR